jgi:hypothetical protein
VVDLARPHDHGPDHPGRPAAPGGVLSAPDPDPDELLLKLRSAAGEPPLPPLRIGDPSSSARRGLAGSLVGGARRAVLRLIAPSLSELLAQLERDRHRQRAELARLAARVAELEREREG